MARRVRAFDAVFFDLDGTLVDTAKDMAHALNRLRREENLPPLDDDVIRSEVSHGARAMIALGFTAPQDSAQFAHLKQRFLDIYAGDLHVDSVLFPAMDDVLERLESRQIPWGVVTNKPSWLTLPLLQSMQLKERAATIICADTAGVAKPDAKPLLDACQAVNVEPRRAVYVGDDQRDAQAARHAGLPCIILRSGYIRRGHNPDDWGADNVMDTTLELRQWIFQQTHNDYTDLNEAHQWNCK